jgi:hypothetical protein
MKTRRRNPVLHAMGVSARLAAHRTTKPRPGAVSASELEGDVLARRAALREPFIAERNADRHLDIEVGQLGLSTVAHKQLIVAHLRVVAQQG